MDFMKHHHFYYSITKTKGNPILAESYDYDIPLIVSKISSGLKGFGVSARYIQNALFPIIKNTIFISHFSEDADRAMQLARKIEIATQCKCFVDSYLWASVYTALETLQQENASNWVIHTAMNTDELVYDLEDCNEMAKHLFLILAFALQLSIINSSAFIFMPSAMHTTYSIRRDQINSSSPWVALEILASKLTPQFQLIKEDAKKQTNRPKITYPFSVKHLKYGMVGDFAEDFISCHNFQPVNDNGSFLLNE